MIRRPPRSTLDRSSAASDVYKRQIVYGASDEKKGFMRYGKELLHPKTKLEFGIFHEECSEMVRNFFEKKRKKNTAY